VTTSEDRNQEMLASALRELSPPQLSADFYERLRTALVAASPEHPVIGKKPKRLVRRRANGGLRRPAVLIAVTAIVAAASGAAIAAVLTNTLQAPPSPAATTSSTSSIAGGGISIQLDQGWAGRAYLGGDKHLPVIQAANYPLPVGDDDVGSHAQRAIPPAGIFIDIIDFGPALDWMYHATYWSLASLPISVNSTDFGAFEDGFAPAYARINRIVNGRALQIDVGFGAASPTAAAVAEANHILATLSL
jgi:hypothetical protein